MENDLLQKKDPFLKTISEASTLMEGWKGGKSSNYINKYNEANDGIAFVTDGKEEKTGNKNNKKKEKNASSVAKKGITQMNVTRNRLMARKQLRLQTKQ